MTCAIVGCSKPRVTRGWCNAHYQQWKRTGDPIPTVGITGVRVVTPLRMIVTGSRHLHDAPLVFRELAREWRQHAGPDGDLPPLVVIHGGCPPRKDGTPGADQLADRWARDMQRAGMPVTIEVFRADWARYGKPAGPIRNGEMVAARADVAVGFPMGVSSGTRDCLRQAADAGIPVVVHESAVRV